MVKLQDLANLIIVRNHIITVMNDKYITKKEETRALNDIRVKIDREFVKEVSSFNVEDLFKDNVEDSKYEPMMDDSYFDKNIKSVFESNVDFPSSYTSKIDEMIQKIPETLNKTKNVVLDDEIKTRILQEKEKVKDRIKASKKLPKDQVQKPEQQETLFITNT